MVDKADSPIFVTGVPRSGASMVAGVFQICGAFLGETPKPERNSPRGMYENKRIHDGLIEPYFQDIKADPFGQYPIPDKETLYIPVSWKARIQEILKEEGYDGTGVWGYKSNKMALLWPIIDFAYPNAKWVIVRRRSGDIINSCLNTTYMKAFKDEETRKSLGLEDERAGWVQMVHEYESRFRQMVETGLNCHVIWPDRMVNGDYSQLYEVLDWVGLKWTTPVIGRALEYIDPKFWKVRRE